MNNNDKPNTENTSQENTSQENTSSPSSKPEKEAQSEKVPQTQPQLVDSPVVRGMDSANATAAKVLFTRGNKEFVNHVFTDQDTGRRLSYAEMRMRYG
tara:strand:- start:8 stop:301 length:294 start_codon:yes stop_codon:yes gene_type:complete